MALMLICRLNGSDRDERNKNEFPDDQAEMIIPALMMLGRAEIPAFLMATTKGEDPAPAPPLVSAGSLDGQMTPIARTEPT